MRTQFVEKKRPNLHRVAQILRVSEEQNRWANGGPVSQKMAREFREFLGVPAHAVAVPCANGGIGLEAMARLWECRLKRPIRWAVSTFSFRNLGRGYFANSLVVDCDESGLLDLDLLMNADTEAYSGIVLVNPLGLVNDFEKFFRFARERNIPLLLDNAAGLGPCIPDWDWQVFSLHHTKPFGMGEGGLVVIPAELHDAFVQLIEYGDPPDDPARWLNNGKISDISCSFILDRLLGARDWMPEYQAQRERILRLAAHLGLRPLANGGVPEIPVTSLAFLAEIPLSVNAIRQTRHVVLAKYYHPLADLPVSRNLFARIVNVPAHPTMSELSDAQIQEDLGRVLEGCDSRSGPATVVGTG